MRENKDIQIVRRVAEWIPAFGVLDRGEVPHITILRMGLTSSRVGRALSHCAQLAGVDPTQQSGTIRHFRKLVTLAQLWWLNDGAAERCGQMLSRGEEPPLMLYLIWSEYTRLSKAIAAAAIFGPSISRCEKLVALPAGLISRFEAARDPKDL